MSAVEELRRLGNNVVLAWERLGQCEEEFVLDRDACAEYHEILDMTITALSAALTDHALLAEEPVS